MIKNFKFIDVFLLILYNVDCNVEKLPCLCLYKDREKA